MPSASNSGSFDGTALVQCESGARLAGAVDRLTWVNRESIRSERLVTVIRGTSVLGDAIARRALRAIAVSVAVLVIALAPLLNVLCDLQAAHAGDAAPAMTTVAAGMHGDAPDHPDGDCCMVVVELVDSGKPLSPEVGSALQWGGMIAAPALAASLRRFGVSPPTTRSPSPPFEPVFRRFPRLLI